LRFDVIFILLSYVAFARNTAALDVRAFAFLHGIDEHCHRPGHGRHEDGELAPINHFYYLNTHIIMTYSHAWYMRNKDKILEKYRVKKQEDEQRKKEACHFEIIYGLYTVSFD
jgi:hypothetical protein